MTVTVNSPVDRLMLFANFRKDSPPSLVGCNITFVLNAGVNHFYGLSGVAMNVTVLNSRISVRGKLE